MSKKLERLAAKLSGAGYAVYSDGGKIHIKPSHRGRLTELKERTGKSEEELYNDGNPAHKKMVVFARNARQWRHDTGGPLGVGGAAWLNPLQYAKWLAYKIGTYDMVSEAGSASPLDIVHALARPDSEVEMDDNKWAYLFGTGDRYPEVQEPIRGFNYDNYLKDSGYGNRNVKNVYGTINPEGAYSVDPRNQALLTELAKNNWHMYDNADSAIFEPMGTRYRDDVGQFIHQFELTPSGQVMVHDSDVYDFKPQDYANTYNKTHPSWLVGAEAWLMDKIGQPYIIRQENQPVSFQSHKLGPGSNIDKRLDNMTGDEVANITNTGSIQPAVVYDHAKGGPLGSEEGDIPAAIVTPRPENVALYTYGVSGNYPITHSRLVGNGLLLDKGRVDPSYNLLKANCADATGDIIGGWNNIDLTYGLTTPKGIENATRSIYGNTPEYRERRMPGVTIQSFQVPWYDLRTARDAANQMEFDRVTAGMSPEEIEEVRQSYNRDLPKLPYYIDRNGNVIPVQQSYNRGGMLRVLATGGPTYGIEDKAKSGDRYYDIVKARYDDVMGALKRRGFSYNDAARVAPMIIMQNNLEGGWTVNRKDNNFGGMKAGNNVISYDSVDEFYDAYLDMLDSKWGGDKDSPDNWRNAKDIKDWARILNHEDLGLDTEEKFKAYNRTHRDNPVYLYAPEWDNGGKKYGEILGGVQNRTLAYLDMVTADSPYENWTAAAVREKLSGLPKIQSTLSSNPGLVKALLEARTGPHNYIEWKANKGL